MDAVQRYADELAADMRRAVDALAGADRVGPSLIQRRLGIGYNKACSILDGLVSAGVLSAPDDDGKRQWR